MIVRGKSCRFYTKCGRHALSQKNISQPSDYGAQNAFSGLRSNGYCPIQWRVCLKPTNGMDFLAELKDQEGRFWNEWFAVAARKGGSTRVPRRTIFVHLLMQAIRHYAQFAALARQHGFRSIEQWTTSPCAPKVCSLVDLLKSLRFCRRPRFRLACNLRLRKADLL